MDIQQKLDELTAEIESSQTTTRSIQSITGAGMAPGAGHDWSKAISIIMEILKALAPLVGKSGPHKPETK